MKYTSKDEVHMKTKAKRKRSRYLNIVIVPDAEHRMRTLRIPKCAISSITCLVVMAVMLFSGLVLYTNWLGGQLSVKEDRLQAYKEQVADRDNTIKGLEDEIDYYAGELQSIMSVASSLQEQTSSIADNNRQILGEILHLLGLESIGGETYDADTLSSRSGTRPRPKTTDETRDTTLEQSHILTVNEFVKADQKVSSVREFYEHLSERGSKMRDYLLAYPSILPVEGRISCLMGERDNPFGGRKKEFHSGLDIAVPRGTDVKATGKGRVIFSGRRGAYGYLVIIDHGFDIKTYYAHNSKLLVEEGDIVERGHIIAKSGNTGRSTGPHVHYEVRIKDTPKDPLEFVLNFDRGDE